MTIEELQEQLSKAATSIQKLEAKNEELIGKLKTESARADDAESVTGTELEKAVKRAEKAERDFKAANERADTNAKSLREYKRDAAISAAIATANVDSHHVAILTKALRGDVEFDDMGEATIGGKAIDAYAKSFFAKEGASYVRVADHNGGNSTGSEGARASSFSKPPETPEELHNWMKFTNTNKDEAVALANTWGRADLRP